MGLSWASLRVSVRRPLENDRDRLLLCMGEVCAQVQRTSSAQYRHLWDAEFRVFSQFGEDGILNFLCDFLDLPVPRILELGAGNFRECNSRFLVESRLAPAVLVDRDSDLSNRVKSLDVAWKTHLVPIVENLTKESAPSVLERAKSELGEIDILSVDIDGVDYWVLESLVLDGFKIIVVEYNSLFGSVLPVSVPYSADFDRLRAHFSCLYYGASLPAFDHLLCSRGFRLAGTNRARNNAFFVRAEMSCGLPGLDTVQSDFPMLTSSTIREGRDPTGALTFSNRAHARNLLVGMPVINVVSGEVSLLELNETGEFRS